MDNFSYQSPTRYVFGKGVENQTESSSMRSDVKR